VHAAGALLALRVCMSYLFVCAGAMLTLGLSPPGGVFLYVTTVVMSACSKTAGYECLSACRSICLCCSMGACSMLGNVVRRMLLCAGPHGHHIMSARSYICKAYYILVYRTLLFQFWCKFDLQLVQINYS